MKWHSGDQSTRGRADSRDELNLYELCEVREREIKLAKGKNAECGGVSLV